jgi:DNA-binding IclR family transcriptional regulator
MSGARADSEAAAGGRDAETRPYAALRGVARAMEILEAVAARPMRASEIAELLGLKWTTAHRSLTHLHEHRYLARDDSGIYRTGPRLYYLAQSYLHNHPLLDAGSTALRALAYATHATAQLNEREGFEARVLMSVDPSLEVIPRTTAEHHFPLHCGAKGQVLLAFSSPALFEAMIERPLDQLTARTITDPNELREVLHEIRETGFRITREDVQFGTAAVAAPVFGAHGTLAGSTCIILRRSELTDERSDELVAQVTGLAREVSLRLGWRSRDVPDIIAQWRRIHTVAANGARRPR